MTDAPHVVAEITPGIAPEDIHRVEHPEEAPPADTATDNKKKNPGKTARKVLSTIEVRYKVPGEWYRYLNGVWDNVHRDVIHTHVLRFMGDRSLNRERNEVMAHMSADANTFMSADEDFNPQKHLVNVRNGMIDANGNYELIPHDKKYMSSIQLPIEYDPTQRDHPTLDYLLDSSVPDKIAWITLQEIFGYCLTTSIEQNKLFLLHGITHSGKSTTLDILSDLVGANHVSGCTMHDLSEPFQAIHLRGKLINIQGETKSKDMMQTNVIKNCTKGEVIASSFKGKDTVFFRPFAKLIFSSNPPLPKVTDSAFFSRLIMVEFPECFTEKKDNTLDARLRSERVAIFNWALDGLKRLNEQGHFTVSGKMQSDVNNYERDGNPVQRFVEEQCSFVWNGVVEKALLYSDYKEWCKENGLSFPLPSNSFFKEVYAAYPKVGRHQETKAGERTWVLRGICLSRQMEVEPDTAEDLGREQPPGA